MTKRCGFSDAHFGQVSGSVRVDCVLVQIQIQKNLNGRIKHDKINGNVSSVLPHRSRSRH